jgi:hypothetical protein
VGLAVKDNMLLTVSNIRVGVTWVPSGLVHVATIRRVSHIRHKLFDRVPKRPEVPLSCPVFLSRFQIFESSTITMKISARTVLRIWVWSYVPVQHL